VIFDQLGGRRGVAADGSDAYIAERQNVAIDRDCLAPPRSAP
jgi:hypothetical protein